jgi:transcriptional regulator with XRE-family HTH domain
MVAKKAFASDALQYTSQRYIGNNPEQVAAYEEELANAELARKIYDLRTEAGLTQRQLAKLVGTTASVICRLEDGNYEGHSLAMLRRIAVALDKRVESLPPGETKPEARLISPEDPDGAVKICLNSWGTSIAFEFIASAEASG